ncbi:MAG: nucleic acid/nucleotide deaminase domain-containing protein [Isosphaeraceae bacterium]
MYYQYNMAGAGGLGLGGRNCATIYYRRAVNGNLCHVTNSSVSGVGTSRHSERVCYDDMIEREGGRPQVIALVYTERFPCGPQNMNCLGFLHGHMPNGTAVFWSFEWPDAADIGDPPKGGKKRGRDEDDVSMRKRVAKQRRAEGTRELKLAHRDYDYRGSVGGGGGSVTVAGEADLDTCNTLELFAKEKKLPVPFSRSPVWSPLMI